MIALRKTVIRMFEHALQSRNASTWTNEELAKKLKTLPALTGTYIYPLRPDQVQCPRGGKYGVDIEQKPYCIGCPVSEWYVCDHKRQEIKTGIKFKHENDGLRVKVKDVKVKRFLERVFLAIRLKEKFTVVNSKKRKRKLESKRKEIMTLTRDQAVKLLVAMNYKTAGKWDTERIQKKIDSFAELAKEEEIEISSEKMQTRFDKIVKALKKGKSVVIDDNVEVPEPAPTSKKKKKKVKKAKKAKKAETDGDTDDDDVDEDIETEDLSLKKKKKVKKAKKTDEAETPKKRSKKKSKKAEVKTETTDKKIKKAKKKETKKIHITRLELVVRGIIKAKKNTSILTLAKDIDDKFVSNNGNSNVKSTQSTIKTCLTILSIAGVVEKERFLK